MSGESNRSATVWLGERPYFRVRLVAFGVGAILLFLTLSLWNFSLLYLNYPQLEGARQNSKLTAERLADYLEDRMTTLKAVAQFYAVGDTMTARPYDPVPAGRARINLSERDFQRFCVWAIGAQRGIANILLTDTDGSPIWVAPESSVLGEQNIFALATDLRFRNILATAAGEDQRAFTEPIALPLLGSGMLAAAPVFQNRNHIGFIVGVLPLQEMTAYLLSFGIEERNEVRIEAGGRTILPREGAARRDPLWLEAEASSDVEFGNQRWSVTVTPLASQKASLFNVLSMSIGSLGIVLTGIAIMSLSRMMWRAVRLASEASDQRVRLEDAGMSLMQTSGQLDAILNGVDEGIVLYDRQLRPVQANGAFLSMFRLKASSSAMSSARQHHDAMVRQLGRETRYYALFESLKDDPARGYGDEIEPPDRGPEKKEGRRAFSRRAIAVSGDTDDLHSILVIYKDVTMIKDMERVKDEFLSSVTHELRSPLASIKGFAETMQRDPAMPEGTRAEFVSIICEESARLQHLIEELLDIRRMQSKGMTLRISTYSLKALAQEVARGAHSVALAKNIKVQFAWDGGDEGELQGDAAQMSRALRNLVVNAVKYSPPGGVVYVRGGTGHKTAWLEVADQGTGISEKDLPYVFDQFYRGQSQGRQKGTGLGLAIVKHTVELHGGHLGVRSEAGAGASFRIELPRTLTPAENVVLKAAENPADSLKKTQAV